MKGTWQGLDHGAEVEWGGSGMAEAMVALRGVGAPVDGGGRKN